MALMKLLARLACAVIAIASTVWGEGGINTSFGSNGVVSVSEGGFNTVFSSLALDAQGRVVVAGTTTNGTNANFTFWRYDANGTLDTTFGSGGKTVVDFAGYNDYPTKVKIHSSGNIVAVGYAGDGTYYDAAIVRLDQNGNLDATFGNGGKNTYPLSNYYSSFANFGFDSNGKIVAVGSISISGSAYYDYDMLAARINCDGTPDTSFDSDGWRNINHTSNEDSASLVHVYSDDTILMVGYGRSDGVIDRDIVMYRLNSNGSTISSRYANPDVGQDIAQDLEVLPDGSFFLSGYKNTISGSSALPPENIFIARYLPNGDLNTSFGSSGYVIQSVSGLSNASDVGRSLTLQDDGKVVVGGYATNVGTGYGDFIIFRYNPDGTLDTTFGTNGYTQTSVGVQRDIASDMIYHPSGRYIISGQSTDDNTLWKGTLIAFDAPVATPPVSPGTLAIAPGNTYDFGDILIGGSEMYRFTLTNTSGEDINITNITAAGDVIDFSYAPTSCNHCVIGSVLAEGGFCYIDINASPTTSGLKSITLNIANNSSNLPNATIDATVDAIYADISTVLPQYLVNESADLNQYYPTLRPLKNGGFVAGWIDEVSPNSNAGYYHRSQFRVFDANGTAITSNVILEDTSTASNWGETIGFDFAPLQNGGFLVVYHAWDGWIHSIFSMVYDEKGALVGTTQQVTSGEHRYFPKLAPFGDDTFLLATHPTMSSNNPKFKRISSSGSVVSTTELTIPEVANFINISSVGVNKSVAIWEHATGIRGAVIEANSTNEIALSGNPFDIVLDSSAKRGFVDGDINGTFIVAWNQYENGKTHIKARLFDLNGTSGALFDIARGDVNVSGVALYGDGFIVQWEGASRTPNNGVDIYTATFGFNGNMIGTPNVIAHPSIGDQRFFAQNAPVNTLDVLSSGRVASIYTAPDSSQDGVFVSLSPLYATLENSEIGMGIGIVTAISESGSDLTYTLTNPYFDINETTGELVVKGVLDYEGVMRHNLLITAANTEGKTTPISVIVEVINTVDTILEATTQNECISFSGYWYDSSCHSSLPSSQSFVITSIEDDGDGSLRGALAGIFPFVPTIIDLTSLSGQTIALNDTLIFPSGSIISILNNGSNEVNISGSQWFRTFYISGATVNIQGVNFVNGGGIETIDSDLNISKSLFFGNRYGGNGGALYVDGGDVNITDSHFIYNEGYVDGNPTANGGAIYVTYDANLSLNNTILNSNSASTNGGAIYVESGDVALVSSTIGFNNSAGSGEGGDCSSYMDETTCSSDQMCIWDTQIEMCMGRGMASGGGVYNFGGNVAILNTIISNNTDVNNHGPDCFGNIISLGNNLISNTQDCNITLQASDEVNVSADLNVTYVQDEFYTLVNGLNPTSPAIDSGICTSSFDIFGNPRPQGNGCDIGAIESPFFAPTENNDTNTTPMYPISISLSNVNLIEHNITNIEYIGVDGNSETLFVPGVENLQSGTNTLTLQIANLDQNFSLRFDTNNSGILQSYWYNFQLGKFYSENNGSSGFKATAFMSGMSVNINATSSNWVGVASGVTPIILAYFPFDGNATNILGGSQSTEFGGVSYIDGIFGSAASFDGVDDKITASGINLANSSFSFSFFIKLRGFTDIPHLVMYRDVSDGDFAQVVYFAQVGTLSSTLRSGNNEIWCGTSPLIADTWAHVAYTYDISTNEVKNYVNGMLSETVSAYGPVSTNNLLVLANYDSVYANMALDELRIYNYPLTQTEVDTLFNSATFPDTNTTIPDQNQTIPDSNLTCQSFPAYCTDATECSTHWGSFGYVWNSNTMMCMIGIDTNTTIPDQNQTTPPTQYTIDLNLTNLSLSTNNLKRVFAFSESAIDSNGYSYPTYTNGVDTNTTYYCNGDINSTYCGMNSGERLIVSPGYTFVDGSNNISAPVFNSANLFTLVFETISNESGSNTNRYYFYNFCDNLLYRAIDESTSTTKSCFFRSYSDISSKSYNLSSSKWVEPFTPFSSTVYTPISSSDLIGKSFYSYDTDIDEYEYNLSYDELDKSTFKSNYTIEESEYIAPFGSTSWTLENESSTIELNRWSIDSSGRLNVSWNESGSYGDCNGSEVLVLKSTTPYSMTFDTIGSELCTYNTTYYNPYTNTTESFSMYDIDSWREELTVYLFEPYPRASLEDSINNSCSSSNTLHTSTLYPGWNIVSLPSYFSLGESDTYWSFGVNNLTMYKYSQALNSFLIYKNSPSIDSSNKLSRFSSISPNEALWVYNPYESNKGIPYCPKIDINTTQESILPYIYSSWGLIGVSKDYNISTLATALSNNQTNRGLKSTISVMWKFDNQTKRWQVYTPKDNNTLGSKIANDIAEIDNLTTVERDSGVWVRVE